MTRIKMTFGYDGTEFAGYQVQPNQRTVQAELDAALSNVFSKQVHTTASGRTDRGVHAVHQVAHFDIQTSVPVDKMPQIINAHLPDDISITAIEVVPEDFHARYDVREKTYCYVIDNQRYPRILHKRFAWHIPQILDIQAMVKASRYLIGEHDFTSFCSSKTEVQDKVRTIYDIGISAEDEIVRFYVKGNGFLYNMVRTIVGSLVEVGKGRESPEAIETILEAKDRTQGLPTAPPQGLILWNILY